MMIFFIKRWLWLLRRENRWKEGETESAVHRTDIQVKCKHRNVVAKSGAVAVGMKKDGVGAYFGDIRTCRLNAGVRVCVCV